MASTSDFRNGFSMEYSNGLWTIIQFLHVKPGKGPAFVRTKLKNLVSGKVVDKTFPSGHKVVEVRIERRTYQYLYKDDMGYNFMNNKTYDQISLEEQMINAPQFLLEGQNAEILFHAEKELPLLCELPQYVIQEVTYTEPGVRGDTATNATKPATLESGAEVNVPLFINEGDKVRIGTADGNYMERVRS
ncbi:MAG: elongation factor P [Chitinophagales bacterium]